MAMTMPVFMIVGVMMIFISVVIIFILVMMMMIFVSVVIISVTMLMITMRMGNDVMKKVVKSVVISRSGGNCQSNGGKCPYNKILQHFSNLSL